MNVFVLFWCIECRKGFWEKVILNRTNPRYMEHSWIIWWLFLSFEISWHCICKYKYYVLWIKVCLHYNKHVHVLANYSPYVFESGYLSKNRVHYCTSFVLLIVTASWFFYKTFEVNELIYTWLLYVYLFSLNGPPPPLIFFYQIKLNLTLSGKENEQFVLLISGISLQ